MKVIAVCFLPPPVSGLPDYAEVLILVPLWGACLAGAALAPPLAGLLGAEWRALAPEVTFGLIPETALMPTPFR
jgi:hypothetical protein